MSVCSVGEVQLNPSLECDGLRNRGYSYRKVAYAYGGMTIDVMPDGLILPDITLNARFEGGDRTDNLYGHYTLAQIEALLALPNSPQPFQHPYAVALGITGITVFVDKNSIDGLIKVCNNQTRVNPSVSSVYQGTNQVYLYYGQIRLERLT